MGKTIGLGIVRYLLGCIMIGYGVTKILQTQFVILPFHVWQLPLEEVWGGSLAWAFLSYSPWFQVFLGFCELIPAILLLFRRTALLGAILMLPLTCSVMLINFALQLWPSTQVLSGVLFVLNLAVFLFEKHKLQHMITVVMGKKEQLFKTVPEALANIGLIGFLLFAFGYPLFNYRNQNNNLIGDWFNQHPNEWVLQDQLVNDSAVKPGRLYFMPYDTYVMVNDTIANQRGDQESEYRLDEQAKTLFLYQTDTNSAVKKFSYVLSDSALKLISTDTGNSVVYTYKRRVMNTRYHR
ncbi:MAG: DoxX family protein [Bacteroidota bacterium]